MRINELRFAVLVQWHSLIWAVWFPSPGVWGHTYSWSFTFIPFWWFSVSSLYQLRVNRIHSDTRHPAGVEEPCDSALAYMPMHTIHYSILDTHLFEIFLPPLSWSAFTGTSLWPCDWEHPMSFPHASPHNPGHHFLIWSLKNEKRTTRETMRFLQNILSLSQIFFIPLRTYIFWNFSTVRRFLFACFSHLLLLRTST